MVYGGDGTSNGGRYTSWSQTFSLSIGTACHPATAKTPSQGHARSGGKTLESWSGLQSCRSPHFNSLLRVTKEE